MDSPPADQDVQAVIELELRLHKPEVRAQPGAVEALLHPGFSEFGASGRRWGRTEMLAALAAEQPVDLGPGDYIVYPGDAPHIFKALEPDTAAVLIMEHI